MEINEKFYYDFIEIWASQRNLIEGSTSQAQFLKLISELGEFGFTMNQMLDMIENVERGVDTPSGLSNVAVEFIEKAKDDVGDQFVVLTIIALQEGHHLSELFFQDTLFKAGNPEAPLLLYISSLGKLADAILKRDTAMIPVFIGMAADYLRIIASAADLPVIDCLAKAWNDIKDRKGVMWNGSFVKSTDPLYSGVLLMMEAKAKAMENE